MGRFWGAYFKRLWVAGFPFRAEDGRTQDPPLRLAVRFRSWGKGFSLAVVHCGPGGLKAAPTVAVRVFAVLIVHCQLSIVNCQAAPTIAFPRPNCQLSKSRRNDPPTVPPAFNYPNYSRIGQNLFARLHATAFTKGRPICRLCVLTPATRRVFRSRLCL